MLVLPLGLLMMIMRGVVQGTLWVMLAQCLKRRIPDQATLTRELGTYTVRCNQETATTRWRFDIQRACTKLVAIILRYRSGEMLARITDIKSHRRI